MLKCLLGNGLWTAANFRAWRAFRRARRDPRAAQERILLDFLRRNADTAYGRKHGYRGIDSVDAFRARVPVATYDDFAPWIDRIRNGEPNVLTAEPVLMLEKTSGSSGAAKYIPYTASLRREFQNAIGAWMFDLFTNRPSLLAGRQYWSISPAAREPETTPGGLPVGFEDDTAYLDPLERRVVGWVQAVPGTVARATDMDAWRRRTVEALVRARDLRFISVWNPSFLTLLLDALPAGTSPRTLWPHLRLVSCWTDGTAGRFVPALADRLPGVEIQGKGLLATEGVISFPETGRPAASPAITSHFLEFLGADGLIRRADELETGGRYRVLLTMGGGFARYDLGDEVEAVAPGAIRFTGRAASTSDVCGEKLSEIFVGGILEEASRALGLRGLLLLAPEWDAPPYYTLFIESGDPAAAAALVERRLCAAHHYEYCRRLGQLAAVRGVRVVDGARRYLRGCVALGQRAGDVKPAALRKEFGWRNRLEDAA